MLKRTLMIAFVLAALGTGLAACGGSGGDSTPVAAQPPKTANGVKVSVQDNRFAPGYVKVKAGDTVTFTNDGAVAHTVTGVGGATFDSGTLAPGKTFSFIAEGKGKLTYVCTIHAGMKGTIEVD
jgi:plastocyanin